MCTFSPLGATEDSAVGCALTSCWCDSVDAVWLLMTDMLTTAIRRAHDAREAFSGDSLRAERTSEGQSVHLTGNLGFLHH